MNPNNCIYVVGSEGGPEINHYYDMWIAFSSEAVANRICDQWNDGEYTQECTDYYVPFHTTVQPGTVFTVRKLPLKGMNVDELNNATPLVMCDEVDDGLMVSYEACCPADHADAGAFYVNDYIIYGEGLVNGLPAAPEELD